MDVSNRIMFTMLKMGFGNPLITLFIKRLEETYTDVETSLISISKLDLNELELAEQVGLRYAMPMYYLTQNMKCHNYKLPSTTNNHIPTTK